MCGVAGWFGSGAGEGEAALGRMLAAIRHRGPDGDGRLRFGDAALGHVRLAIIDLAGGAQPMAAGGVAIAFNGEIYNYRPLRAELAGRGYPFRTDSDTEVILALYRLDGWQALARLRGMYALALWDEPRRCGWLLRDPAGIKPLFYAERGDTLLFASEAKGVVAHGAVAAALEPAALHLTMNFRYLPGEGSLFRGVRQLAPGEAIEWREGRVRHHRLPAQRWPELPLPEALADSVAAHLTADVEVAAYLSGGIDSAAVVALARGGGLRRTFTLAVGDDPAEAENAAATARLLGVENCRGEAAGDLTERLPRLVRHLELPKVNALQVSALAALAARHVKVALSGLGGDELFLGYNAHRILYRAAQLARWSPRLVARVAGGAAAALLARLPGLPWGEAERAARMVAAVGAWPRLYGLLRNLWDTPALRRRLYGPRLLDAALPDAFAVLEGMWPAAADPLQATAQFEWRRKMVDDLLWQEDRASMAEGLEVRVPFVDQPLAQAVATLSPAQLMPGGRPKGYLREALRPLLPAPIVARPKSGFQVDAPAFFHAHLLPPAREWLSPERLREHGLFNPAFVAEVLAAPPRRRLRWHYFILYLMLMSHLWIEQFEGRER